eukprot:1326464-Amphidinium_carterae.1
MVCGSSCQVGLEKPKHHKARDARMLQDADPTMAILEKPPQVVQSLKCMCSHVQPRQSTCKAVAACGRNEKSPLQTRRRRPLCQRSMCYVMNPQDATLRTADRAVEEHVPEGEALLGQASIT